ncbi:SpoIIE family protein phosphatase [Embleya scabrispora]|uniref:SpoIIE family protein phosphatase n=1 Tax=Embleya scabrispora TaxID=159449 RepID=UPI001319F6E7|nr:SpoIIE family protein phosphatase [Embleya scabrispora]MYS81440.1 SpoIIE family protein phosphatase [Streptomyces sp. SID5474]
MNAGTGSTDPSAASPALDIEPEPQVTTLAEAPGLRVATRRIFGPPAASPRAWFGQIRDTPLGARAIFGDVAGDPRCAPDRVTDVLTAFAAAAPSAPTLSEIALQVALSLREDHRRGHRALVRLLLVAHVGDPTGIGSLTLINRGYPTPLLVVGRRVLGLEPAFTTPPIGALAPGSLRPSELAVTIGLGERVLLYTDDPAEASDTGGDRYPLVERAPDRLHGDFADALDRLAVDIEAHSDASFTGDAALFLLESEQPPQPDQPRQPEPPGRPEA